MTIEPDRIRAEIDTLLAELASDADADLDAIARRLNELHDILVHALESVEKG